VFTIIKNLRGSC